VPRLTDPPDRPDPAEELVDVVDDHDRVVATVTRARMRAERLRHRCTFVVLRRSDGRVLVHRRSGEKDLWPGCWDVAAGGVVGAGEAWEDAAARELAEEVGVRGVVLRPLGGGTYADDHVDEVARIWTATWDGEVSFDDGEVVEAHWVTPEELAERLGRDRFVPDSLALVVPHVLPREEPP
jgi:isopentenyldiphosphate isomerase